MEGLEPHSEELPGVRTDEGVHGSSWLMLDWWTFSGIVLSGGQACSGQPNRP